MRLPLLIVCFVSISSFQLYPLSSTSSSLHREGSKLHSPPNNRMTISKRPRVFNWLKYANPWKRNKVYGKLILVRAGESQRLEEKIFAGWTDIALTNTGLVDVQIAGRLLREYGYTVDVAYTSVMKRAIDSTHVLLRELKQVYRPVITTCQLNGRMYGGLEGISEAELSDKLGKSVVSEIRKNLTWYPPSMTSTHPNYHISDRRYQGLESSVPQSESILDVMSRSTQFWHSTIWPQIVVGKNVLLVAHTNSLKGIIQQIDDLSIEQLGNLELPNSIPLMYQFDGRAHRRRSQPLSTVYMTTNRRESNKTAVHHSHHHLQPNHSKSSALSYLFDGLIKKIVHTERSLPTISTDNNEDVIVLKNESEFTGQFLESRSFSELFSYSKNKKKSKHLNELSSGVVSSIGGSITSGNAPDYSMDVNVDNYFDGNVHDNGLEDVDDINADDGDISSEMEHSGYDNSEYTYNLEYNLLERSRNVDVIGPLQEKIIQEIIANYSLTHRKPASAVNKTHNAEDVRSRLPLTAQAHSSGPASFMVIIRHGKTEFNKLGLFTGWEDALLAEEGKEEAKAAGILLRRHAVEFDIVFTSWLTRAIETSWSVLSELNLLWLPIIKNWRLNERMYGALTGLSKKMVGQQYGVKQMQEWRHSYSTRPPKLTSFSPYYPGNDERYVKYVKDLPVSIFETFIRSIANNKLEIHYRFPKTESLQDSMERTIPYYKNFIYPNAIAQNKRVLIATSENAIRGLLMHLCQIPPHEVYNIEIPTGLPLVFDFNQRCIKLLDDGKYTTGNPLTRYYFGAKPELLFQPCDYDPNDESAVECFFTEDGRTFKYNPIIPLPPEQ